MLFWILITLILLQRGIELDIARKNKQWILDQGGFEAGKEHYKYIVLLHGAFFASLISETVLMGGPAPIQAWGIFFTLFLFTQVLRIWCIATLGRFWNTRIMILPNAQVVSKGPYRWIRHPNYVIVAIELIVIPLMFGALFTALCFTLLNALLLLLVRIPAEEKALRAETNYAKQFVKEIVKD